MNTLALVWFCISTVTTVVSATILFVNYAYEEIAPVKNSVNNTIKLITIISFIVMVITSIIAF